MTKNVIENYLLRQRISDLEIKKAKLEIKNKTDYKREKKLIFWNLFGILDNT